MRDVLASILAHAEAFRWLLLAALVWTFYRVVNNTKGIEFADFIAVCRDGRYHGDPAKLGLTLGNGLSVFTIVMTIPMAHKDFTGFSLVLGMCLGFLGGTYAYVANIKSKQGQTTTITEPLDDTPKKVTVTQPSHPTDVVQPVAIVAGAGIQKPLKVTTKKERK